jgi:hypothetical protein
MALAWTTIQTAIKAAVDGAGVTGLSVGWRFTLGPDPLPAKPFCMLQLIQVDQAINSQGGTYDELRSGAQATDFNLVHQRRHMLSVQVYTNTTQGDGSAFDALTKINRHLGKQSTQAALLAASIRMWQTSGVRDLSAVLDTRDEGRAQCDYMLATQDTTADNIGNIATVDLTGVQVDAP